MKETGGRTGASMRPLIGERVEIHGVEIDALTPEQVVERVMTEAAAGRGGSVLTPNLEILRLRAADPALQRCFDRASLVVADGMPLLWAARLAGRPLPARVAGSDLIWALSREAAARGLAIYLLGGNPGVAERAAAVLVGENPALRVAGTYCPPLGFEEVPSELERMRRHLAEAEASLVMVGLPFPMADRQIDELRRRFPELWFFGLGITLSFVAGEVRRAPAIMQRTGTEWIHRLAQEPGRLAKRYLVHGLPFLLRLLVWALRARAGVRHRG